LGKLISHAGLLLAAFALVYIFVRGLRNSGQGTTVGTDDDDEFTLPMVNPETRLPMDADGVVDAAGNTFGSGSSTDSED
jgi:hypothetical protein